MSTEVGVNQSEGKQAIPQLSIWVPAIAGGLVVIIFLVMAFANLSGRETVLLGVVQTLFSLIAGWAVTHLYAQDSERRAVKGIEEIHQRNLRTYALKAAEKVENVSRELNRLAIYLNQELEEDDYSSESEELSAKEERIQSAIHILNTLKSVNDTSLSDWKGVIGDEIEGIRQRAEQREEALEKIVDRIERLESQDDGGKADVDQNRLVREIDKLRRDLKFVAGDVAGNLWTAKRTGSSSRQSIQFTCPDCGAINMVRQRVKEGARKGVTCVTCGQRFVSEIKGGNVDLQVRRTLNEHVSCATCSASEVVALDELAGASVVFDCAKCSQGQRVTRTKAGLQVVSVGTPALRLTEEIIVRVSESLPPQPWSKGVHDRVAEEAGLPPQLVKKAINQLILRGVFMDQFRGQVCTTEEKLILLRTIGSEL